MTRMCEVCGQPEPAENQEDGLDVTETGGGEEPPMRAEWLHVCANCRQDRLQSGV